MKRKKNAEIKFNRYWTRARGIAACVFVLLLTGYPFPENWNVEYRITSLLLPLCTYELEYGVPDADYISDYQVPDWLCEDEDADQVTAQEEAEKPQEPVIAVSETGSGVTYKREELSQPDFLLSHIFVVDNNTSMLPEELDAENLLNRSVAIDLNGVTKEAPPKILIYHTHGSEAFCDSREGEVGDTVVGVGSRLAELLEEKYDIPVYHDTTLYDVIDGQLDRSRAYENAYNNVSRILQENPSIEVVLDLHRDGVNEDTHLVTQVDGKPTAKIMFLNGVSRSNLNGDITYLENPNKKMNLAFSFQLYLDGKEKYGDYVRKIYVRSLRYNLHLLPRTALIEVGAQNNTVEEEKNAMEPFAAILHDVLANDVQSEKE